MRPESVAQYTSLQFNPRERTLAQHNIYFRNRFRAQDNARKSVILYSPFCSCSSKSHSVRICMCLEMVCLDEPKFSAIALGVIA